MPFDAVGQPIEHVYSLSDLETGEQVVESQIHKVLASQVPTGKQRFVLTSRTGAQIPVEDSATPILEGNELVGAVTIFTNIAARIAEEKLPLLTVSCSGTRWSSNRCNFQHSDLWR